MVFMDKDYLDFVNELNDFIKYEGISNFSFGIFA